MRVHEYPRPGQVALESDKEDGQHQPDGHSHPKSQRQPFLVRPRRQSGEQESHGAFGGPNREEEEEVAGV